MTARLNRWALYIAKKAGYLSMVEVLIKVTLSLLPFLKEWFLGKPTKKGKGGASPEATLSKKIFVVVGVLSICLSIYLFNRLWIITKRYEEVLKKETSRPTIYPPVNPPREVEPSASSAVVTCAASHIAPVVNKPKSYRIPQEDYSEVITILKE